LTGPLFVGGKVAQADIATAINTVSIAALSAHSPYLTFPVPNIMVNRCSRSMASILLIESFLFSGKNHPALLSGVRPTARNIEFRWKYTPARVRFPLMLDE
jgi:hypothetical protein